MRVNLLYEGPSLPGSAGQVLSIHWHDLGFEEDQPSFEPVTKPAPTRGTLYAVTAADVERDW